MIINVTQHHIDIGERNKPCGCPIWFAVLDSVGRLYGNPSIGSQSAWVNGREYPLPFVAQKFIADFDNNNPVQPFTFEL